MTASSLGLHNESSYFTVDIDAAVTTQERPKYKGDHVNRKWLTGYGLAGVALAAFIAPSTPASAYVYTVVHNFTGSDGDAPAAGLMQARDGNFYGTTFFGGSTFVVGGPTGFGVAYQLTPAGVYTVLHNFGTGGEPATDGEDPSCQLIQGISPDDNLYGTATEGGTSTVGTIYSLTTSGTLTPLVQMVDPYEYPVGGLLETSDGTLYGTASGTSNFTSSTGIGAVFSCDTSGGNFQSGDFSDGINGITPVAPLILGLDGNLYGTCYYGGAGNGGSIYSFSPSALPYTPTDIYTFDTVNADPDGANPEGALYQDASGNFYSVTVMGAANQAGAVCKFQLINGVLTLVWDTQLGSSTASFGPQAALIMASDGQLYGTTGAGGANENGDIYTIDPTTGAAQEIYVFNGSADGAETESSLLLANDGYLYGTTESAGANGFGTIFKFSLDPNLTSASPSTITAGNTGFTLTMTGSNFNTSSVVQWNGTALTTTYVSPTEVTAAVPSSDLTTQGSATVDVINAATDISTSQTITIDAAPSITSINPTDIPASQQGLTMTITGTGFVDGDTVTIGGFANQTPTALSATSITVDIPVFLTTGAMDVTVVTADGVSSNAATLTVHAPAITSLNPTAVTVGNTGFTLTINGTFFPTGNANAVVQFGTHDFSPVTITETKITVSVPQADVANSGAIPVQVLTADGDGPSSNIIDFQVNPTPTIATLSPTNVTAGHATFTLTITGTGFVTGDTVSFDGHSITPNTGGTATQLQITVPTGDVNTAGTIPVFVVTPDGVDSNSVGFTVNPAPAITTLSPTDVTAGHPAFTLTITGTNFVNTDTVEFGTHSITPIAGGTATQLQISVPAGDVTTAGNVNVNVVTADGVDSNTATFTVDAAPTVTGLNPNTCTAGHATFNMDVTGTNLSGATIFFGTHALSQTANGTSFFVPVSVPASLVTTAGVVQVTAVSADGVTSNQSPFTITAAPTISSISPTAIPVTQTGLTMTITGTNFNANDTVTIGGNTGLTPTSETGGTTITVGIPTFDTAGPASVTVVSSDGVSSNAATLDVDVPTIASISPTAVTAGNPGFILTVNGTFFPSTAEVQVGTDILSPVSNSGTVITVAVQGSDVATPGQVGITILTNGGDGPSSNTVDLQVNAAPAITTLSPASVTAGHPAFTLLVNGSGFVAGDTVSFGGHSLTPTSIAPGQIQVSVPAADVAAAGSDPVFVVTPDGVDSNTVTFTVNPAPAITSLSPTNVTAGHPSFTLLIAGTNFVTGDTVSFGGQSLPPTTDSTSTLIHVTVPAADVTTPGNVNVFVATADGVDSNTSTFAVNPTPAITSISPTNVTAGHASFTLTVNGSNFAAGDTISFGGQSITPTSLTAAQIQITVPAADVATAGNVSVFVVTPDGVDSNTATFTVNPAPSITTLSPTNVTAGHPSFTLAVDGTNFVTGDVVSFGSRLISPTSLTATQILITVPAADVATAGNVSVFVVTADGVDSNTATFTVNPAPSITTLSPTNVTAGHPTFTLTITGTNFVTGDTVNFGSNALAPTSLSATQIQIAVPASDVATSGPVSVTVATVDGVDSNAATFTVNPAPTIASLSPTSITKGHLAFTLTITGTNFATGDTVEFGSNTLTPNAGGTATQLQVSVPTADFATAGPISVTVVTADGVSSNAVTFTVNPTPAITSLSPTGVTAGHPTFTLTITGTGFLNGDTVMFGTHTVTPNAGGTATQLQVTVPAADVATAANLFVTVISPDGVSSNSVQFNVNAAPAITSIAPTNVTAGHPAFSLTITGTGFAAGDTVSFGSNSITPASLTGTQIQIAVPAADVATAGDVNVNVVSADGVDSNTEIFVVDPTPVIVSLSPNAIDAGRPAFILTIAGGGFAGGDTVAFGSDTIDPSLVTAAQIQVTIPAADLVTPGSVNVFVTSPDGVQSNVVPFSIGGAPTITSISPTETTAGNAAFTLSITGLNFAAGDEVRFGTDEITPLAANLTATSITLTIPANDISVAGVYPVTVFTPAGVNSNSMPFTAEPQPTITDLAPNNTTQGGPAFTLEVDGTNYTNTDVVRWSGNDLTTTFVSPTELQAAVPASDIEFSGIANVAVATADGFTTISVPFTINAEVPPPGFPDISNIVVASVVAGNPDLVLQVNGTNFAAGDTVDLNGVTESTTFVSATQLTASIPAASIAITGQLPVTVVDPLGQESNAVPFKITPIHTYPVGLQMICAPYDYSGDAISAIIDELNPLLAVWNPATFEYDLSPTAPADTFHQGQGAWANFHTPADLLLKGADLTAGTGKLTVTLTAGWNMIGDPYSLPLSMSSLVVVDSSGNTYNLSQANAKGIVYATLYGYDTATGQYDSHIGDSLQPYTGYWIDAFQGCTLQMPTPD